jgi:DNA-directed RNA polymerase subunit omega
MIQKNITNEALKKKFKNQFEMVGYAISLAENMILTGRDPRVKSDTQNRALQILEEIVAGKDHLEPVALENKKQEEKDVTRHYLGEKDGGSSSKGAPERKRARKILVD